MIEAHALTGLPEMQRGDNLAALLTEVHEFTAGQVLVLAHKVVSKAEGQLVVLDDVKPSPRALELTALLGRHDARHVEVVLREASEVVRAQRGVLICRTHHGFVCANAGVDASNAPPGTVVLLPRDPDASARALRAALPARPAVIIADSFGRAWRNGQCDVAIGVAGLAPLQDWRGEHDSFGRELHATVIAIADEAASAADLARRGKAAHEPAVVITGLGHHVIDDDGPGVGALLRARDADLFG